MKGCIGDGVDVGVVNSHNTVTVVHTSAAGAVLAIAGNTPIPPPPIPPPLPVVGERVEVM